jgi:hypothetical protein
MPEAAEQGFRVLEAGVRHRCKQLALFERKSAKLNAFTAAPLVNLVGALHKAGKIPEADVAAWKAMVGLRNRYSHPTDQYIRKRHDAIEQLAYVAELLNRLFKCPCSDTPVKQERGCGQ